MAEAVQNPLFWLGIVLVLTAVVGGVIFWRRARGSVAAKQLAELHRADTRASVRGETEAAEARARASVLSGDAEAEEGVAREKESGNLAGHLRNLGGWNSEG